MQNHSRPKCKICTFENLQNEPHKPLLSGKLTTCGLLTCALSDFERIAIVRIIVVGVHDGCRFK